MAAQRLLKGALNNCFRLIIPKFFVIVFENQKSVPMCEDKSDNKMIFIRNKSKEVTGCFLFCNVFLKL